eukprot:NODE_3_length_80033_cov_0.932970.p64 type:complete len:132 gc:universal NODE_3_length_80033_cov_0.932970:13194-12799(-)
MLARFMKLFLPGQAKFVHKIIQGLPITTIHYAMTYFYRTRGKFSLEYNNFHLFISCLVISDKFTNDFCAKNFIYANTFHINLKYLNYLEGWVMRFMDYTFRVQSSELMVLGKMLSSSEAGLNLDKDKWIVI